MFLFLERYNREQVRQPLDPLYSVAGLYTALKYAKPDAKLADLTAKLFLYHALDGSQGPIRDVWIRGATTSGVHIPVLHCQAEERMVRALEETASILRHCWFVHASKVSEGEQIHPAAEWQSPHAPTAHHSGTATRGNPQKARKYWQLAPVPA
jgi:hypothetical protein